MNKAGVKLALSGSAESANDSVDWELRPGGMLVQLRDPDVEQAESKITVKVSYGLTLHEISISPHATFGDLKKLLSEQTGLQAKELRLLFRGREKDSMDYLHVAGVKENSKIILVEDPACRERRLQEARRNEEIARACKAIADVSQEVDKLAGQISILEGDILSGTKVLNNDLEVLIELLMHQLLKLDGIKADGDAKLQRRIQVRRVQNYVEAIDGLKFQNDNPNPLSSTGVTRKWETFESGMSSHMPSTIVADWEQFD
eukprot:c19372_g1_i1 orf=526-1302(+)